MSGCCGGIGVGFSVPRLKSCKSIGKKDPAAPVQFDSVRTDSVNGTYEQRFYLDGKIHETWLLEDDFRNSKDILVFDTTINDTFFRVHLDSKYIGDSLIDRNVNIDKIPIFVDSP